MKIVDINGISRDCIDIKPDPNYPGFVSINFTSKRDPSQIRTEWYPIEEFSRLNPGLKSFIKSAPPRPPDITGVVSKTSEITLKDATADWKTNCYAGFTLWISRGQGEGQIRSVVKNTKNTVTIDKPWDVNPDKSSQYVVSLNVHNPSPQGNTLPGEG